MFFNSKRTPVPKDYVQFTLDDKELEVFEYSLKQGYSLFLNPSRTKKKSKEELQELYYLLAGMNLKYAPVLVVDEAGYVAGTNADSPACSIATMGLGQGLIGVFTSQRPAKIHNDILTQCETIYLFKHDPIDRKYLVDVFGKEMATELYLALQKAGVYHYAEIKNMEWDGKIIKSVIDDDIRRVDS